MIICLGTTPTVQRTLSFNRLTLDAVNRAAEVRESASGKSINVARTLHTLQNPTLALGFLGGDTGRFVRDDLTHAGIQHQFIEVKPRTRTCVTLIDRNTKTVTELVEESAAVDERDYDALFDALRHHLADAQSLVLSGSLTPGAPQDFYARCTRVAKAAGAVVILDGRGEPLRHALAECPDVIKPNLHELAETVRRPLDDAASLQRAVTELLELGSGSVIVTNGPHAALVSNRNQSWWVTPPAISAISPIGSGDALAAGLAKSLVEGCDLPTATAFGTACGAANALNSPPGHAKRDDIRRVLEAVTVTKA